MSSCVERAYSVAVGAHIGAPPSSILVCSLGKRQSLRTYRGRLLGEKDLLWSEEFGRNE